MKLSLLWIKTWHDHCNSKRKWKEFGFVVKMFSKNRQKCFQKPPKLFQKQPKVWILFSLFRQLLVRLKKSFSSRQRGYLPQFLNGLTWWRFACKHTKFEMKFLKLFRQNIPGNFCPSPHGRLTHQETVGWHWLTILTENSEKNKRKYIKCNFRS